MRKLRSPRVMTVMALAAGLMLMATTALAAPPASSGVVDREIGESGYVYSGDGVHVLTGPVDLADGCLGEGFSEPIVSFINRPNGTNSHHFTIREGIAVFADEGIADVFEWLDMACGALLDGDPATVAPEPLATGEGKVVFHFRMDADEVVHVHNGATGKVVTADGRTVHINTFASYTEDASGLTLHQLRVNYGG
jgi:hypothetical protein